MAIDTGYNIQNQSAEKAITLRVFRLIDELALEEIMLGLARALKQDKDFAELLRRVECGGCPLVFSGLESIHKAHTVAAAAVEGDRPILLLCADETEAERLRADLSALCETEVYPLYGREFTFFETDTLSRTEEQSRLKTLAALLSGKAKLTVATVDGLTQRTLPPQRLRAACKSFGMGASLSPQELIDALLLCGYKRSVSVEGAGQFAARGSIVDFFSPAHELPIRCDFFGDEIDSIGFFDVESQRRIENIPSAELLPASECMPSLADGGVNGLIERLDALLKRVKKRKSPSQTLVDELTAELSRLQSGLPFSAPDKYFALCYKEFTTAADYLPPDAAVFISEPSRCEERAKNQMLRMNQDVEALLNSGQLDGSIAVFLRTWTELTEGLTAYPVVFLDSFLGSRYPLAPRSLLNLTARQLSGYGGSLETAAGDIIHYRQNGYRVIVFCADRRRCEIMTEFLKDHGVSAVIDELLSTVPRLPGCTVSVGTLSGGMEYPGLRLAVLTEGQFVSGFRQERLKRRRSSNAQRLASYTDLTKGDLVVHEAHGIGRFLGIERIQTDGVYRDYVKIGYAGTDILYVPAMQLDSVSKYIGAGGEDTSVKLSKLGGTDWAKAKSRAKKAAQDLAAGLIQLYAQRSRLPGFAFSPDTVWQQEFEERFEYAETQDQLKAIAEIKADMEKPVPMDRLLCGDVGFGKTEVALRAVMKCVMDGKQAAILVPTTVLAQQHYVTAMKRFAGLPIRIEVLSRFRTGAQLRDSLNRCKDGSADIIIGTHKLLQKGVFFKNLGLLVVDEEQRFGVSHKERLKEISGNVDVLTLSATPIPRTLNMALAGIRDMSTIEEPPMGRRPIQTYVLEHNWSVIADAIRRELERGGQVYYLHNRVDSIDHCAARIAELVKGASIAVAHGKMDERSLNTVMDKVAAGEVQVLVCTTIIEAGIDISNVNTLIIEDADKLGLAQLHQIRGRVGRSSRRAYAYFTFKQGKVLTEIANKRLSAIREFAEFNSGFRIAMRDLEIRGAGNLLGAEQSGHMISVGFDLYMKLLEEAVLEQKGETKKEVGCTADITVDAGIPESYVDSSEQRMDLYRRIALIRSSEDADDMMDELLDRYGDPPVSVENLIRVAILRCEAADAGICDIAQKAGFLRFKLTDFDMHRISALYQLRQYQGQVKVEAGTAPCLTLKVQKSDILKQASQFVRAYKEVGA